MDQQLLPPEPVIAPPAGPTKPPPTQIPADKNVVWNSKEARWDLVDNPVHGVVSGA